MTASRVPPPPPEPLLRAGEAAELLAISTRTLSRMTKEGDIPVIRLRKSVRYRREDVKRLIDEHTE